MNASVMRWCLLLLLGLGFPTLLFAASAFEVAPGDKSVEWLGMVFGTVPHTPVVGDNALFSQMIEIFNQGVFGLGIIVISYTAAMGAINTAHEGQFLGKNWHPILVPLRAGVGIMLIVPQANGFNYMQIIVMWFIVQGIGAANAMWVRVIEGNQVNGNIHEDTRKADLEGAGAAILSILKANVCMTVINGNASAMEKLDNDPIVFFRHGNKMNWGRQASNDANPLCGSVELPAGASGDSTSVTAKQDIFAKAIRDIQNGMSSIVDDILAGSPGKYSTTNANVLVDAARTLRQAALDSAVQTANNKQKFNDDAKINGWILAGSYYYQLTQYGSYKQVTTTLIAHDPDTGKLNEKLGDGLYSDLYTHNSTKTSDYFTAASSSIKTLEVKDRAGPQIIVNPRNMSGQGASIFAAIFGSLFEGITQDLQTHMTSNKDAGYDPLVSIMTFGSKLTTVTENVFFAALGLAFALWLVTTPMSCLQPLGHAFNFLLTIFMPIAMLMISLLWVAGLTLGLYIPMIPYLVFTFSALSWIILVIEAMLAAPLIALGLIVPNEDEMGKAGHAIVILLGIFLRPALMVLGFIMAIQLLIVAINMLNVGFWASLVSATGGANGIGVFGLIAVLLLYASIALGMVHEAFSLIYLVPNKVMRWIGAGGDSEDPMSKVKELKGSVQKGAGIGGGLMKSTLKAVKK
jgi:conjugal transfer/type IV secretion protein DotA/TraY